MLEAVAYICTCIVNRYESKESVVELRYVLIMQLSTVANSIIIVIVIIIIIIIMIIVIVIVIIIIINIFNEECFITHRCFSCLFKSKENKLTSINKRMIKSTLYMSYN